MKEDAADAMLLNEYALDLLVRERLSEARVTAGRRPRPAVRAMLGGWLIRLGTWILAEPLLDAR